MACIGIQPYISIGSEAGGAKAAVAWYKNVLGATVRTALASSQDPDKLGHAELAFGSSVIMLSDQFPGMGGKTPKDLGGCPITFTLMIPGSSKEVYEKALQNGAQVLPGREYKSQPWGWNAGSIEDPFGYQWTIGEEAEKISTEEIAERLKMKDIASQF